MTIIFILLEEKTAIKSSIALQEQYKNALKNNTCHLIKNINKDHGHTRYQLKRSYSWPLSLSEFGQTMDDWEVWDLTENENEENEETATGLEESTKEQVSDENERTNSIDETKEEGKLERSTRVSVRTSFHSGSNLDLTASSSGGGSGQLEDSLLEEVKITYVFKEKNKSNENLSSLTKSCDVTPRRQKWSLRQSLRERLSVNFNNNNSSTSTNNKSLDMNTHNNKEKQANMISKSKSMEHLNKRKDDESLTLFRVGESKRHYSDTRSDLTSVGLDSYEEENEHTNVFTESGERLKSQRDKSPLVHHSTPSITRSHSYTEIKRNKPKEKGAEEVYVLSVPSTNRVSMNRAKSLEHVNKMESKKKPVKKSSPSPQLSPVVSRHKTRAQSESFRIDSGYYSPDDARKDSLGGSATEAQTPYTITFTPETSNVETPTKNHSPSIKQGLASMIPIGVGETMTNDANTSNIIHNVESAHSVEEHGTFNLSIKKESPEVTKLSFTEEEEYVDIDFVIENEEPTAESTRNIENDIVTEDPNMLDGLDKEECGDFVKGFDEPDCAKYRLEDNPPLEIRIQCPSPIEKLNESIEEESDSFQIMHSTRSEVTNQDDSPFHDDANEQESATVDSPERQRNISISNDCSSTFEDSINSFEAHEREYALASLTSTPTKPDLPTPKELTAVDEEYDVINTRDSYEEGDSRRMTMALLDYLPSIKEEDDKGILLTHVFIKHVIGYFTPLDILHLWMV